MSSVRLGSTKATEISFSDVPGPAESLEQLGEVSQPAVEDAGWLMAQGAYTRAKEALDEARENNADGIVILMRQRIMRDKYRAWTGRTGHQDAGKLTQEKSQA
jgi:hypothetical protein